VEEFESLDASLYTEAPNEYELEFKNLLLNIYSCYLLIIADKKKIPNNENKIRDILLEYLKNIKIRQESCLIEGYRFDKEVDEGKGRVDIKIVSINDFENFEAYFIIECKRLDGTITLNKKYDSEGIDRFTSEKYSSYYGINGMIGFVVKKIDIDANIKKIGNFFDCIEKDKLYISTHTDLKLYHLMMDFSALI
jgi:hypothetical protein